MLTPITHTMRAVAEGAMRQPPADTLLEGLTLLDTQCAASFVEAQSKLRVTLRGLDGSTLKLEALSALDLARGAP